MLRIFGLFALSFALFASFACSKKKENPTPTPQDTTKKVYPNKLMGGVWKQDTIYYRDPVTKKKNPISLSSMGNGILDFSTKDSVDLGYVTCGKKHNYSLSADTLFFFKKQQPCLTNFSRLYNLSDSTTFQFLELQSVKPGYINDKNGDSYWVEEYYRYKRQK
jgi:hypothetical protein